MESKNYKIVKSFISKDERKKILDWIESTHQSGGATNIHLSRLADSLKGRALMFNQSKTELTNYITKFQTISDVSTDEVPEFILDIQKRIADYFNFPLDPQHKLSKFSSIIKFLNCFIIMSFILNRRLLVVKIVILMWVYVRHS